jgi:KDO2-lipid IV(A) lauroyltransferase
MALARGAGNAWYFVVPIRRRLARENVRRVFGARLSSSEQRAIVRRSCQNLTMTAVEILRLPYDMGRNEALVSIVGRDHLDAALAKGCGVILVCSHAGNIDLLGISLAIRGYPFHAIVKKLHWKPLDAFVQATRRRSGTAVIGTKGSSAALRSALASGGTVLWAIDQHMPRRRGIVCRFFGELASTTPAPARYALATGAALVPAQLVRTGAAGHHVLHLEPELALETPSDDPVTDARHITERLNRIAERWIEHTPDLWLWQHRRWRVQDDPARWDIPEELRLPPAPSPTRAQL